jgi:hypothetical protein
VQATPNRFPSIWQAIEEFPVVGSGTSARQLEPPAAPKPPPPAPRPFDDESIGKSWKDDDDQA